MALRPDGTLWTWGGNDGNLGDDLDSGIKVNGDYVELYRPFPGEVADVTLCAGQTISNTVAVAAGGDDYTVVVDAMGTVWAFGENTSGQLGIGVGGDDDQYDYPVPTPISGVTGFTNVVSVAAGFQHTLALCADGTVWAWGDNENGIDGGGYGQLGAGYLDGAVSTNSPVRSLITNGTVIVAIAAGNGFSLALDKTGLIWGWGGNGAGVIGATPTPNPDVYTNLPILVAGISNVIAIAAGDNHSVALTSDKRVWTFGDNSFGELGRNTGTLTYGPSPEPVSGLNNVVAIAGGLGFTLAVTSNGQVCAWGDNTYGELGTNTSAVASNNAPMLVTGISNAVWVSAPRSDDAVIQTNTAAGIYSGGVHSLVMTVDQGTNHYWGFGDNTYGQVGNVLDGGGTNLISQYSPAGPLQFCTRCQRNVQLGTNGSFTAQCNGTLYLYFNDEIGAFNDNSGSFTVTVNGVTTNVPALDPTGYGIGIAVGTVTNGGVYPYTASGSCFHSQSQFSGSDANGYTNGVPWDCSNFSIINITNAVCPTAQCFSLVGKIQ